MQLFRVLTEVVGRRVTYPDAPPKMRQGMIDCDRVLEPVSRAHIEAVAIDMSNAYIQAV